MFNDAGVDTTQLEGQSDPVSPVSVVFKAPELARRDVALPGRQLFPGGR